MTCAVCGCEFCWLCMKEISDLHYLRWDEKVSVVFIVLFSYWCREKNVKEPSLSVLSLQHKEAYAVKKFLWNTLPIMFFSSSATSSDCFPLPSRYSSVSLAWLLRFSAVWPQYTFFHFAFINAMSQIICVSSVLSYLHTSSCSFLHLECFIITSPPSNPLLSQLFSSYSAFNGHFKCHSISDAFPQFFLPHSSLLTFFKCSINVIMTFNYFIYVSNFVKLY